MDWRDWVTAAFQASLFLTVFSIGLKASHRDALYLFHYPRALLVSVLSMAVVMPALAVAATFLFRFHPAVKIALVALSVSPVPPFLPLRILKAGGKPAYTISLLATTAALSVIVIPIALMVLSSVYAVQARMSPMTILPKALVDVLLPLFLGMMTRTWRLSLAMRLGSLIPRLAMALLFLSLLLILFDLREAVFELVSLPTFIALGGFALLGFLVGDLLGGLEPEDRTVLAFATAMRHPGMALSAAHARGAADQVVFAAVLMYMILGILVSTLYLSGRKRLEAGPGPQRSHRDPTSFRPV